MFLYHLSRETSAQDGINVKQLFQRIADAVPSQSASPRVEECNLCTGSSFNDSDITVQTEVTPPPQQQNSYCLGRC